MSTGFSTALAFALLAAAPRHVWAVGPPQAGPTGAPVAAGEPGPVAPAARLDVPFVEQRRDTCAAAALAMVLGYWGANVGHDEIAAALLQPELHGILGSRLVDFARRHGFEALAYRGDAQHLRSFLAKGRPLIVAWKSGRRRYHNVVVVGYDTARGEFLVHDPALGRGRPLASAEFERRWAQAGYWTMLVLPAAPPSETPS